MPAIIKIILHRILSAIIAILVFLGLAPETPDLIETTEYAEVEIDGGRRSITDLLNIELYTGRPQHVLGALGEIADIIDQKRQDFINVPQRDDFATPIRQMSDLWPGELRIEDIRLTQLPLSDLLPTVEPAAPQVIPPSIPPVQPISVPPVQPIADPETTTPRQPEPATTQPEPAPTQPESPQPEPEPQTDIPPEGEMRVLADVVVNIICTQQKTGFTTASTGSGVIISPNGVVLTNAHVAQFFLLEDAGFDMNCAIYRENIPTFGYKADIMYISPTWVENNRDTMTDSNPRGTGEDDFALLIITKNTNPVLSIPSRFSYAKVNTDAKIYRADLPVVAAGFPGAPISFFDLARAGTLRTDNTQIEQVYSFNHQNHTDVFSTQPTAVAARGASGGGIFHRNELIGITTTISAGNGTHNKINAITTTYINNTLSSRAGGSLISMITDNPLAILNDFKSRYLHPLANLLSHQL